MHHHAFLPGLMLALCISACGSSGSGGTGGSTSASTNSGSTTGTGSTTITGTGGSGGSGTTTGTGTGGESGTGHFIILKNACSETIWAAALNAAEYPLPENGGWKLSPGQSYTVALPAEWGGRFWGRSGCTFDAQGKGKCETGDCGGKAECAGNGGKPPATLVEITFGGFGGKDFYDVSLVDGYNLPMGVTPRQGTFTKSDPNDTYDCGAAACTSDVNPNCPPELAVKNTAGTVVACRSAHEACNENPQDPALQCAALDDLYRCSTGGPNDVQGSCYSPNASASCCGCPSWSPAGSCNNTNPKWAAPSKPEAYAKVFKDACPTGYSFPYDDPTSTFTCKGDDYVITFCP